MTDNNLTSDPKPDPDPKPKNNNTIVLILSIIGGILILILFVYILHRYLKMKGKNQKGKNQKGKVQKGKNQKGKSYFNSIFLKLKLFFYLIFLKLKSFFNLKFLKKSNKSKAPTQTHKSKPPTHKSEADLKSGEFKQSILYLILISLVVISCVISIIAIIWASMHNKTKSNTVLGNPPNLENVKTINFQNGAKIDSDNGLEINIEKLKDNNMKLIGNNASANFQLNNTGDSGNIVEFENLDSSGGHKGDLWYFNNENGTGVSKPEPDA